MLFSSGIDLFEVSKFSKLEPSNSSSMMLGNEPFYTIAGLNIILETRVLVVSPLGFSGEIELWEATERKNLLIVLKVLDKNPL
jgi:hypothetical protein